MQAHEPILGRQQPLEYFQKQWGWFAFFFRHCSDCNGVQIAQRAQILKKINQNFLYIKVTTPDEYLGTVSSLIFNRWSAKIQATFKSKTGSGQVIQSCGGGNVVRLFGK